MTNSPFSEKLQENRSDYYGSKYSEHLFGKSGGSVTDPNAIDNSDDISTKQFWKDIDQEKDDYTKKQNLSDKKRMLQREKLISSSKVFNDIRPKYFIRSIKGFFETCTPEEIEALITVKNNFFYEWKKLSFAGVLIMMPFIFYYRSFMNKGLIFMTGIFFPIFFGFTSGAYMTCKTSLILMDKLGNEYLIGRLNKQTIFSKRKDLSDEIKAEIYQKMNKENQEIKDQLKKSSKTASNLFK